MTVKSRNTANPASRRGFMRQALRQVFGAGASLSGLAGAAAMAADRPDRSDGKLVLLLDPDGYLIERGMMLAERETLAAIVQAGG